MNRRVSIRAIERVQPPMRRVVEPLRAVLLRQVWRSKTIRVAVKIIGQIRSRERRRSHRRAAARRRDRAEIGSSHADRDLRIRRAVRPLKRRAAARYEFAGRVRAGQNAARRADARRAAAVCVSRNDGLRGRRAAVRRVRDGHDVGSSRADGLELRQISTAPIERRAVRRAPSADCA